MLPAGSDSSSGSRAASASRNVAVELHAHHGILLGTPVPPLCALSQLELKPSPFTDIQDGSRLGRDPSNQHTSVLCWSVSRSPLLSPSPPQLESFFSGFSAAGCNDPLVWPNAATAILQGRRGCFASQSPFAGRPGSYIRDYLGVAAAQLTPSRTLEPNTTVAPRKTEWKGPLRKHERVPPKFVWDTSWRHFFSQSWPSHGLHVIWRQVCTDAAEQMPLPAWLGSSHDSCAERFHTFPAVFHDGSTTQYDMCMPVHMLHLINKPHRMFGSAQQQP